MKLRETTRQQNDSSVRAESPENRAPWLDRVVIRLLKREDLPDLEWDGEFTHFRRVYADAYQRMLRGLSLLWVAELPGKGIIGQVFIQLTCDRPELADGRERAYLYSFRVRKEYRSKGLGARILETVEEDLRQREFKIVTLNVARDNIRAQQLYIRKGYRVVAPEPGIWSYPDEKGIWHRVEEPAWRMEKKLL
ncbi:MAG: GNAT family N-acetyltransferase [Chloroflexi bacterium]|nr:GNAT family N-acetyltransferase [Chloroflexota bacterium]